ncbi:ABC-type dipeptide/oligopeptide/nickel transport system, permease component [Frankia torreyi]|uniref:ABC-type dipeptide/oligopeptide/nickel transport system, permease component n=2 Tax=Frankia TaxID=1854 RepID=A0A0D8B781_9ACTN|nr:ABC-type dipeptide/oligopeptide/nickel transport system, permease component [Frankia torreyi]KQM03910.1 ABC-type dipeptide/oligopeptide/nickel transport system, permease component [Frankia sp. CpI1-P]
MTATPVSSTPRPDGSAGPARARVLRGVAAAVGRRVAAAAAVMLGAATTAFIALHLLPGDPVAIILGPSTMASPEVRAQIRLDLGLDQPLIMQYLRYLGRLLQGDLGDSYQLQQPVSALIGDQLRPTVELALAAIVVAVVLAVASAVATAGRRPGLRALANLWELVAVSTPSFWLGILLLTAFSFRVELFPVAGADGFSALVLPALTLGLPVAGILGQVLREGLETALEQPFATTARARGLSQTAVRLRHALRHAAVPLVTLSGWLTGTLLGGAVLVEKVFARPGIGALTLQAVSSRDMPVVMGVVLLSALVFVVISTAVDLLYLAIDPRLRAEGGGRGAQPDQNHEEPAPEMNKAGMKGAQA